MNNLGSFIIENIFSGVGPLDINQKIKDMPYEESSKLLEEASQARKNIGTMWKDDLEKLVWTWNVDQVLRVTRNKVQGFLDAMLINE